MAESCPQFNLDFEPLYDRVLVFPLEGVREIGDVILPDSAKEDSKAGIVVAVGCGYRNEQTGAICPLLLSPGDQIVFGPYAGLPIVIGGQEFLLMREGETAGRLRNKPLLNTDPAVCDKCHQAFCLCTRA